MRMSAVTNLAARESCLGRARDVRKEVDHVHSRYVVECAFNTTTYSPSVDEERKGTGHKT
jgi:hypothetical protein